MVSTVESIIAAQRYLGFNFLGKYIIVRKIDNHYFQKIGDSKRQTIDRIQAKRNKENIKKWYNKI